MEASNMKQARVTLCDKYSNPLPYFILGVKYSVENSFSNYPIQH
jgi:hypothetical protein